MKLTNSPISSLQIAALAVAALSIAFSSSAQAASSSWLTANTGTGQTWINTANWSTGAAPGATVGSTTNTDTATFGGVPGATTVTIDSGRNIENFVFGTGVSTGTSLYTFTGGPAEFRLIGGAQCQSNARRQLHVYR